MSIVTQAFFARAVAIRRRMHEYPEVGFDLPRTTALVAAELGALGIPTTSRYGQCSVVGYIGSDPAKRTLAFRADMDALPVQEKTDLPFRSKVDGKMHACGHDANTASLLGAAMALKAHEAELPCNLRLIFQPSEEGAESGAKMLVENGVMDGVDAIVCAHNENTLQAGLLGTCSGDYMAACIPASVRFYGKTAHAAFAERGVDAVAMAVEAYPQMKAMVASEAGDKTRYIWSVGAFNGGHVHNVVADECELKISFRFFDLAFAARVTEKAEAICRAAAEKRGGTVQCDWHMSTGPIHNDEALTARFVQALTDVPGVSLATMPPRMGSEDFAWYLTKAPGFIFRYGTRNEAAGCTALAHSNDFMIDESGMRCAMEGFTRFAMQF